MPIKYNFLQDIISLLEKYEQENPECNPEMMDFFAWGYNRIISGKYKKPEKTNSTSVPDQKFQHPVFMCISLMNANAEIFKQKLKPMIAEAELHTADDLFFLITLSQNTYLTKSELIRKHHLEITTGTDILKRLKKHEFVNEFPNPSDKRFKRVTISEKGKEVVEKLMSKVLSISEHMSSQLDDAEKEHLMRLLQKIS
jgi:MarR family transcriptional regulator, lower aerobic nicotinate degradation pathway regulator